MSDQEKLENILQGAKKTAIVVSEGHRGKGLSAELVEPLIRESTGNVYATSSSGNERMHKGLRRFGFVETGQSYPSKEHPGTTLALFIWPPGTDGSPKRR